MDAVTQGHRRNGRRASKVGKTLQISDGAEIMVYVTPATASMEMLLASSGTAGWIVGSHLKTFDSHPISPDEDAAISWGELQDTSCLNSFRECSRSLVVYAMQKYMQDMTRMYRSTTVYVLRTE